MLNEKIKTSTQDSHQRLEKIVVQRIKAIQHEDDYAAFLKYFYSYFAGLESRIDQLLPAPLQQYYGERRNAQDIAMDIQTLGHSLDSLPTALLPDIHNGSQAVGALYVLEGSIMGGPYIVKMLERRGLSRAFHFFSGYGNHAVQKWAAFTALINAEISQPEDMQQAILAAQETFAQFENTFKQHHLIQTL